MNKNLFLVEVLRASILTAVVFLFDTCQKKTGKIIFYISFFFLFFALSFCQSRLCADEYTFEFHYKNIFISYE